MKGVNELTSLLVYSLICQLVYLFTYLKFTSRISPVRLKVV
jgi:hypothetical protein